MLDSGTVDALKVQLDGELSKADAHIGIAFGVDLYRAFAKRGWFTMTQFGVSGTSYLGIDVPAYRGTHFVSVHIDVPDAEYKVGTRPAPAA